MWIKMGWDEKGRSYVRIFVGDYAGISEEEKTTTLKIYRTQFNVYGMLRKQNGYFKLIYINIQINTIT